MAGIQDANQSPRVTTPALNSVGRTGDPAPGVPVSTAQVSGSIVSSYGGMVGGNLTLSQIDAARLSDTAKGTLYGGVYRYVEFSSTSSSTAARGCLVMWVNTVAVSPSNYIVTPDGTPQRANFVAGVAINDTAKGYYDFIQTAGVASVKFPLALNAATPAVGDAIFVSSNIQSPQLADDREGVTVSTALLKQFIGVAESSVPTAGAISPVVLALNRPIY